MIPNLAGANVIGRQSTMAQRDANRLHQWASEYTDTPVHGTFKAPHAYTVAALLISAAHYVTFQPVFPVTSLPVHDLALRVCVSAAAHI